MSTTDMYEDLSLEGTLDLWKTLHRRMWSKYAGDKKNERLLLEAAGKYRNCLTGCDRAFADIESRLTRVDGHDEEWDCQQAAELQKKKEAEELASVTLQPGFEQYAASLSLAELQRAYYNIKSFRLQYDFLVRNAGYRVPPAPRVA